MKKDIGTLFDELLIRYIKTIEKSIKKRIKTARDKGHVQAEIRSEINFSIRWIKADENKAKLSEVFLKWYKRGDYL